MQQGGAKGQCIPRLLQQGDDLGKRIVRLMIDDGPGRDFRWTLFTKDAHGLYEQFGFGAPDSNAMVRAAR